MKLKSRTTIGVLIAIFMFSMTLTINTVFAFERKEEPREEQHLNQEVKEGIITETYSIKSTSGLKEATKEEMEKWAGVEKPNVGAGESKLSSSFAATSWNQISPMSSFYYYGQEESNTCGSACSKMALKFLTGTTYSESTIKKAINALGGATLSNIATYLNQIQNKNTYIAIYGVSKNIMKNNLYSGVVTYNAPPIIGLQESINKGWPYNLNSHGVTIYSITSDKSEVAIADPWAGYKGDSTRWFDKSTDDVYTAYSAINVGYVY